MRRIAILFALALSLSGCAVAPSAPTAVPTTSGPLKVRVVVASDTLSYADTWVAKGADLFTKAGLDVDWKPSIPDAAQAMAAVLSGEADVVDIAVSAPLASATANRDVQIFSSGPVGFANFITLSKTKADDLAKQGITPKSSVEDRLRGLKGMTVGAGTAGGPIELALRKAFSSVGLDPDKDVQFQAGSPDAMLAAFKAGRMDANTTSVPNALLPTFDGTGVLWISGPAGEVPAWRDGYSQVWATTTAYAKANPELLKRIQATMKMARDLMLKDRQAAVNALKPKFSSLDPELLAASVEAQQDAFKSDPSVSKKLLQDAIDSYNTAAKTKTTVTPEQLVPKELLVP